ncbi:MAG: methyltransferase domain-containing protein [Polyangiaceae bacterium]|nr:methyltransferase domain-containing protein [Polyangiaceae bacterium]
MSQEDHDPKADALLASAAQGAPAEEIVADVSDELEPASVRPNRRLTPPPKANSGPPVAATSAPPARSFSSPRPPPPSKRHSSQPPPKPPLMPNIEPASVLVAPDNAEAPAVAEVAGEAVPAVASESAAPASEPAVASESAESSGLSAGIDRSEAEVTESTPAPPPRTHSDSQKPVAANSTPPQERPSAQLLEQAPAEAEAPPIPGNGKILASPILAMRIIVVGESAQATTPVSIPGAGPTSDPPSTGPTSDPPFDGPADVTIEVDGPSPPGAKVQVSASDAPPAELIEEAEADALLEQRRDRPPPPPKRQRAASSSEERQRSLPPEKPKRRRPWWEELFSEDFLRAEKLLSDPQVKREVNFIENSLAMEAGGSVLDIGCGAGQHAAELASRGYGVVAYDLSLDQLAVAAEVAQERAQKMSLLQGDMRELPFSETFDGIYCWNTTFGYFEEEKNIGVAQRMFQALKPGGRLVLDVANRDALATNTPCQVWYEGQRAVCMDDANLDFITSRLKVKRSVIMDDGRTRECSYSLRLYSLHELGKLLHDVGFRIAEASGHPATPGVFFGQSSPRIIILAQKP